MTAPLSAARARLSSDLIVAGAGPVGAALALSAADAGRTVVLAAPPDDPIDNRYYALSAAARRFLAALGCECRQATAVMRMRLFAGGATAAINAADCARADLCHIVAAADLKRDLARQIDARPDIRRIRQAAAGLDIDAARARLIFADGGRADAPIIAAADGARSPLAKMAGLGATIKPYRQRALTALLRFARPHFRAAWQWFQTDGVLALLPVGENQAAMIWSLPEARAARLQNAPSELLREIDRLAGEHLGKAAFADDAAATAGAATASFPLFLLRRADIAGARIALVGDSAHLIHPLAGQGLNLGLADARVLAAAIADCPDWSAALARYRRRRRWPIAAAQRLTDWFQSVPLSSAFAAVARAPILQKIAAAAANAA